MKKKDKTAEKPKRIKIPSTRELKRLLTIGAQYYNAARKSTASMLIIPERDWRRRLR